MITKNLKMVLMCRPTHFSVDYAINPWMQPGTVDKKLAYRQWEILVNTLAKLDIIIHTIDQVEGLPDMVFSTDQGITVDKTVLLSNFRYPERRDETAHYKKWFEENNFLTLSLPTELYLEGSGEAFFFNKVLLMGYGFRSTKQTSKIAASLLNIEVVPLELIDPQYYHLDLAFFPLNKNSAFYYPKAFSDSSQKTLQKMIPNLYEFTHKEVNNFAANSLVTDHHVIVQKNNESFNNRLKELGYDTIQVDVSEFLKAGGGIHCLVQILKEQYE